MHGRAYDWWWGQWIAISWLSTRGIQSKVVSRLSQHHIFKPHRGWNNRGEDTSNLLLLICFLCIMGLYISQYTPDLRVLRFVLVGLIIEVIPHFIRHNNQTGREWIDVKVCIYDELGNGISIPITSMILWVHSCAHSSSEPNSIRPSLPYTNGARGLAEHTGGAGRPSSCSSGVKSADVSRSRSHRSQLQFSSGIPKYLPNCFRYCPCTD